MKGKESAFPARRVTKINSTSKKKGKREGISQIKIKILSTTQKQRIPGAANQ